MVVKTPVSSSGGTPKCQSILARFCETVEECGLLDLGYNGYDFTWDNR